MQKIFAATFVIILLFGNIIAQQNTNSNNKSPEISPELRKNAVEFLRQTIKEIPNLKAEENRQYFTIETARLLWKYDEKEARAMFERVMEEVKQSFAKTNEKYKKAVENIRKAERIVNANYGNYNAVNRPSNVYSSNRDYANMVNSSIYVEPEISIYEVGVSDELRRIASLRKRLIDNLTDIEPVLAYQFFTETYPLLPKNQNDYRYYDYDQTETRIITKLLEKNEVDKAVECAMDVLNKKDISEGFLLILREIYEKDVVKGNKLAEELLAKLKSSEEVSATFLSIFFSNAVGNRSQKQPLLLDKSLRELAKLLGQKVLAQMDRNYFSDPTEYAREIKDYAPREALKILQKSKQKRRNNLPAYPSNAANYYPSNKAMDRVSYPSNAAMNAAIAANMAMNVSATPAKSKKPKAKPSKTPKIVEVPIVYELTRDPKEVFLEKLRTGKFTDAERKQIIVLAKEYASANNYYGYPRPDGFLRTVAELAHFSINSADREVADELMKEAEVYVRPEAKNYADYTGKLLLAGGYSSHHPEKSFVIMESMVSINGVIESAVNLDSFIEFGSDFTINGEVNAANFLGLRIGLQTLPRENEFRMFIHNLAKADFQRTTGLADKFAKREVKLEAKVLIVESLIGETKKTEY